jgi:KDO2-lipid IV(A) lauroyltransferase
MDQQTTSRVPLWRFWQPRYWALWLGLALLRLACLLPYRCQLWLGRRLGGLLRRLLPRRRRVAARNLALCFPALDEGAREQLLREHFASLGIALFELGLAWWASERLLDRLVRIEGLEHLLAAQAAGQGVVVLSGHFPAIEFTGRLARRSLPGLAALYRPHENPFIDQLLRRGRERAGRLIPKDSMRQLLRALRTGAPVWYAPDQAHRRQHSALVEFFGVPAMTNTALTQLVKLSGARVVPYLPRRRADGSGYDVRILPALEDFPGESPEADALRVNRLFEEHIRLAPDQYYWVHRRFKGRPPPLPDAYA